MSEHIQSAPDVRNAASTVETPERTSGVSHENEAFDFRLILWVGGGLAGTILLVLVVIWLVLGDLEEYNAVPPGRISELALEEAARPLGERLDKVPGPRLEGIEREGRANSIAAARQRFEARMKRYGWIDRDKGIVHVPIEKAMEDVLQWKEFRTEGKQKKSDGRLALPGRSNSGREAAGGKR